MILLLKLKGRIKELEERQEKILKVLYQLCLDDSGSDTPWSLLVYDLKEELKPTIKIKIEKEE